MPAVQEYVEWGRNENFEGLNKINCPRQHMDQPSNHIKGFQNI